MPQCSPAPISAQEKRRRLERIRRLAKEQGFEGHVEYHHMLSATGGAQYRIGATASGDRLLVFVEAFERDADPVDFSLEAILAHERGHQLLIRHARLSLLVARASSVASEEILASLVGSLLANKPEDRQDLFSKALAEAITYGMESAQAARLLHDLRDLLGRAL